MGHAHIITIADTRTNIQKVLDYLDEEYFKDSTVTMMNDDYLRNSIVERLSQVIMFSEGIATLNENPDMLSKAMLRSSLNDKDINFILNASLKISDISVTIKDAASKADDLKKGDEETAEKANEMIKHKMESMGSLESLITIIKDCLGTSRIAPVASYDSMMEAASQNVELDKARKDMIKIERPVEFNLEYLDLNKISNSQIFDFLNSMLAVDSNSSLELEFPIEALKDDLKTFFTVDIQSVAEEAVKFAKNSAKNSFSFTAEPDPFKTLFDTL